MWNMLARLRPSRRAGVSPAKGNGSWYKTTGPAPWPPLRPYPLVYFIEPSSICNAACVFCHYPQLRDAGKPIQNIGEATFDKALDIVRADCARRNVSKVGISLTPTTGDLLVNRRWGEFVQKALDLEFADWVDVVTNAILMKGDNIETIASLRHSDKLNLCLSTGGVDRETYRTMFGVDRFETVRKNINELLAVLAARNVKMNVAINLRVPDGAAISDEDIRKVYNEASYPWAHYSVLDTFKDVPADVPGKAFLKRVEGLKKRDYVPCGMLDSGALNFHADGNITACGCHYSQMLDDRSLDLGGVDTPLSALTARRSTLVRDWRERNVIPRVCQGCQHYHTHDGLQQNGLMLVEHSADEMPDIPLRSAIGLTD